jgi:hypothetical protein
MVGASTRGSGRNPVETEALINLSMGGHEPNGTGDVLHVRLRHFDPEQRRAGLPPDVAALVESVMPEAVRLKLVNVNPVEPRTVTVQMGAYAEHHAETVTVGDRTIAVDASSVSFQLAPGAGTTLVIKMRLFANQPTLMFPWEQPAPSPQQERQSMK